MFRVVFHGGFGNFWNALMTIPEVISIDLLDIPSSCTNESTFVFQARQVKRCLNAKDSCLSHEALRKELNSVDPQSESQRLIVNPEFVQQLDQSDGANQWSPEDEQRINESI